MERLRCLISIITVLALCASSLNGQDPTKKDKIASLKGLKDICLILGPTVRGEEVMSKNEIGDLFAVTLRGKVPEVSQVESSEKSTNWIALSYISSDRGGVVQLSVYRWVKLLSTGEDLFLSVWEYHLGLFGKFERKDVSGNQGTSTTAAVDRIRWVHGNQSAHPATAS